MAHEIKNVALAGASGSLGSHILRALNKSGRFTVTILTRKTTKDVPTGTGVKVVDFESVSDLTAILKGQDALINATSVPDPSFAIRLMDAAVAAGGLRISFIGIDLQNTCINYLKPCLTVIPLTTLESVGTAIANALIKAEATKNRICYICNTQKTQKDLAELAKQALGNQMWKTKDLDTKEAFEKAMVQLQAGQVNMQVIRDIIRFSISTPGYIQELEKTNNDLLGIKEISDAKVQELIQEVAREKSAA